MSKLVRIGDIVREFGLSASQIRQLTDSGVLPSERSPGGHRVFDPGAVRSALSRMATSAVAEARWAAPSWHREVAIGGLREDAVWRDLATDLQDSLGTAARSIVSYAFTEMLNNALDHSGGTTVHVSAWVGRFESRFEVADDGRGALSHIKEVFGLDDLYDALGELTKGKTTTDPERHTGESIFFTSKAVDIFSLESEGIVWTVDNVRHDQAVGVSDVSRGTRVRWELDPATETSLTDVFAEYTDEDHRFTQTRTTVRLFGYGVRFVSRSEAERLLRGLERFRQVRVDFSGVEEVGQGFVDEVFRVWPSQHPETVVVPVGMQGPVEFMVRRGLPGPLHGRSSEGPPPR